MSSLQTFLQWEGASFPRFIGDHIRRNVINDAVIAICLHLRSRHAIAAVSNLK